MTSPAPLLKGFGKVIATTKPHPTKRITLGDPDTRGLYVRISPGGAKTFTVMSRDANGKQVWAAIGETGQISLDEARTKARAGVLRIKAGLPAVQEAEATKTEPTFSEVCDQYLRLHVRKEGQRGKSPLRSAKEIERIFHKHLILKWGDRPFVSVRRNDVAELLDSIMVNNGPVMADAVLAQLSALFNWYAARSEGYISPIVRGMRNTKPRERARRRVLSDDEIRSIWLTTGEQGSFGSFVRILLLTGQRRSKVATMRWKDISPAGIWDIPSEEREKTNAGVLQLSPLARSIIENIPVVEGNDFIFAGRGGKPVSKFSKGKRALDERSGVTGWCLHDLRRTAKTLMRRARVDRDVSERTLGHVMSGVEGIYDRHDYFREKAEALEAVSDIVTNIIKLGESEEAGR